MDAPKTLQEAIIYFSDPQRCFDYAAKLRWPDGKVSCPRCGSDRNYFIKTRRLWLCRGCDKQFTLKVGTIFEDSALESCQAFSYLFLRVEYFGDYSPVV